MGAGTGPVYEFGPFRLDWMERLLTRQGEHIPLSPKAFEMLAFFVRNSGKALAKDELMKAIWGDTFVEEANLTQTVSVLRKALGEGADERIYIETIPKRGYRFLPNVELKAVAVPAGDGGRTVDGDRPKRGSGIGRDRWVALVSVATLIAIATVFSVGRFHLGGVPNARMNAGRFVPLVTDPGVRLYPSWAPNGKKIAFVGEIDGHLQVFTKTVGSPMSTQVTRQTDDCIHPSWSPDGMHIYFGAAGKIWRVGANGGDPVLIMDRAWQPTIAPDGSALAFVRGHAGTGLGELWISSPVGAPPKRYSQPPPCEQTVSGDSNGAVFTGREKTGAVGAARVDQTRILGGSFSERQTCRNPRSISSGPFHFGSDSVQLDAGQPTHCVCTEFSICFESSSLDG